MKAREQRQYFTQTVTLVGAAPDTIVASPGAGKRLRITGVFTSVIASGSDTVVGSVSKTLFHVPAAVTTFPFFGPFFEGIPLAENESLTSTPGGAGSSYAFVVEYYVENLWNA